jgi:hypothetical protein
MPFIITSGINIGSGLSITADSSAPAYPPTVEYLLVAGGGAGGTGYGGGGGAGGYLTATGLSITSGYVITVTVGAGGTGSASPTAGLNSQLSDGVFATVTAIGGGVGQYSTSSSNGGSGGGATLYSGSLPGTGTLGQGTNGGTSGRYSSVSYGSGGGGGGAGAGGYAGSGDGIGTVASTGDGTTGGNKGNGGAGLYSSITGSSVAYAGGGGGGTWIGNVPGPPYYAHAGEGGVGGGGNGAYVDTGMTAGTVNTGGGGGGALTAGSSGGSGIAVIRYADTYAAATSTTGSPSLTITGGYNIYTWTSSGSVTFGTPPPPPSTPSTVEYLLVAGGGAGGGGVQNYSTGGGGGAGGYRTNTGFAVATGTPITVTVGAGGTGAAATVGTSGENSALINNNSYIFNGSSQYLTANNAALALGTGDFTVEAWVYTTVSSGTQCVYDTRQTDGSATGFYFGLYASNTLLFYTGGVLAINAGTVPINTWTHIALVRVGNTFTVYVNGTSVGTATNSNNFTNTNLQIGSSSTTGSPTGNYYNGYLSNLRVVKGVSVYTGNFTVPTSPLAATQSAGTNISAITGVQTSLLTLQNATIVDNSTYAVAITNTGSVAFSSNSPFTTVTAIGGGRGSANGAGAQVGGSGGGGSGDILGSYSAGTASQGNAGGNPYTAYPYASGGGGGAGATGATGVAGSTGAAGGVGLSSSISGSATYYAGGGGGSVVISGTGGAGGNGGGGAGGVPAGTGIAGTANTGGGGGGSGGTGGNYGTGGGGGSGIVIIRYADTYALATSTTGTPTITTAGGYRTYIWTSSGSITF